MGLFENPYVDPEKARKEVRSEESVTLARRVAQALSLIHIFLQAYG